VQSHLSLAKELGYITQEVCASTTHDAEAVARAINGWIAYLKRAKTGMNEPGVNHSVHEPQAPYISEDFTEKD
jgi:hypothetical protein